MVRFLLSYAEQNALLLPGPIPGYSRSDIQLLSSSISKRGIWKTYHSAAEGKLNVNAAAYTTFCCLWRSLVPSVIIMKPMTDLCWTCHQNSTPILRAANSSNTSKSSTLKEAKEHLCIIQVERSFYKSTYDACRESVRAHFIVNSFSHHLCLQTSLRTPTSRSTTHLTMLNRSIIHLTQDLFTFSHHGSALCLE